MIHDKEDLDIGAKLNPNLISDPNLNYDILHDHIAQMKSKHLPYKLEKFHRHKHKKNKWITYGILRSIRFRDELYVKVKRCRNDSAEYWSLKNNLHVFNCILKRTITESKLKYYEELFTNYQNDTKKTWQTISEIVCKSNKNRKILDKIIIGSKTLTDKQVICDKFNDFFANIVPKLSSEITPQNSTRFEHYLTRQIMTSSSFTLVTHEDVNKTLLSLRTKTSTGIDGISVKLLKSLAPVLTNPLTLIINQSLTMGIFPSKLKIAKVLPLFKKNDPHIMDNYRPISLLTSISKVFEKVVFNQLLSGIYPFNIMHMGSGLCKSDDISVAM